MRTEIVNFSLLIFKNFFHSFCRTKWVRTRGTQYKENGFVLLKFIYDVPVFGCIISVILHEELSNPLIVIKVMETCFNSHYYSYEVKESVDNKYVLCKQSELADYHVLSVYTPHNSHVLMIPPKYYVLSEFDY